MTTLTAVASPLGRVLPQPRLLAGVVPFGPAVSLDVHRRTYPAPPAPRSGPWPELIDEVARAGLRGRGGARFPAAEKMRSVAARKKKPAIVANGTEGEPDSGKDRLLLTRVPHLVVDGALWAAATVGAEPATVRVRVAETPPGYVAGESSALVHWLNGGPAKPTQPDDRTSGASTEGRRSSRTWKPSPI